MLSRVEPSLLYGEKMKEKLETIKINLLLLIKMIEEGQWADEVNYSSFQKLEKINEKLGEVEILIQQMEAMEEM